jgi:hypothetical protein
MRRIRWLINFFFYESLQGCCSCDGRCVVETPWYEKGIWGNFHRALKLFRSFARKIREVLLGCEMFQVRGFKRFVSPMVRRIYPSLLVDQLCNVQPMTQPASLVFYTKYCVEKGFDR